MEMIRQFDNMQDATRALDPNPNVLTGDKKSREAVERRESAA
jgi:hypothetical protein